MATELIETSSLRALVSRLRVPELKYSQSSAEALIGQIYSQVLATESLPEGSVVPSIVECLTDNTTEKFPPLIINAAFVVDRMFDVWARKNQLHDELNQLLSSWRFSFFRALIKHLDKQSDADLQLKTDVSKFVELLNFLTIDLQSWSPVPERSKRVVLDYILDLGFAIKSEEAFSNSFLSNLTKKHEAFVESQEEKFLKVTGRLIKSEEKKCWTQYCGWYSQGYLDSVFMGCNLPESLQVFLDFYWMPLVSKSVELSQDKTTIDSAIVELTNAMKDVFCLQNKQLFKLAESLLDDLKDCLDKKSVSYEDNVFAALECSLVALLRHEFAERFKPYNAVAMDNTLLELFGEYADASTADRLSSFNALPKIDASTIEGSFFQTVGADQRNIMLCVKCFAYCGVCLLVNHVGMKVGMFSLKQLQTMAVAGEIKQVEIGETFINVYNSVTKGLLRVADTQYKARLAAAEKAKKEAEALLQARKDAEEQAARKAEEIAQRTKELKKKREEKVRAEKESLALGKVQKLNIGAWIRIANEVEDRFKLVVKIAASGKYIFVDKMGIRKKEFLEADLIQACVADQIEFISDGAGFEDSLQRVVSRIRVSN